MLSSRALQRIAVSLLTLPLYLVFGPRAEAVWERLNHGDPILEILATLLIVIVLTLIWLAIHLARSLSQKA